MLSVNSSVVSLRHVSLLDTGRILTVCDTLGACFVAYRVQAYLSYYHKIPMNHSAISELLALTFSFYATLGYTFANFYSTILLLRRSINVRSTGRLYVMIYNAAFAVSYFGWLATIVVSVVMVARAGVKCLLTRSSLLAGRYQL